MFMFAFLGGDVSFLNKTISYSRDYDNQLDWYKKVDSLLELFTLKNEQDRINFGVLYFTEPDETGHQFGPYSDNIKEILNKIDKIVGYLIEQLMKNNLFDKMSTSVNISVFSMLYKLKLIFYFQISF